MKSRALPLPSLSIEESGLYSETVVKTPPSIRLDGPKRTISVRSSTSVMSSNIPYSYADLSQSTSITHSSANLPQDHDKSDLQTSHTFFSKKFRSASPVELRVQSRASLHPTSSHSDLPKSPISLNFLDRPLSRWDSTDSSFSTSPRSSPANASLKLRGIFRKSFSPTLSSTKGQQPKDLPGLEQETDPTTLRKHRVRPRGGIDSMYHGYDDLFQDDEDMVEDTELPVISDNPWNEPDYAFFLTHYEQGQTASGSNINILNRPLRDAPTHSDPIPPTPAQWGRPEGRISTPPLSKPSSVTDLYTIANAHASLPPTPTTSEEHSPEVPNSQFLSQAFDIAEEIVFQTQQIPSPGPPPLHTPPPVPVRKPSRKGSVSSTRGSTQKIGNRRSIGEGGLGISYVPIDYSLLEPIEAEIASKGFDVVFEEVNNDCTVAPLFFNSHKRGVAPNESKGAIEGKRPPKLEIMNALPINPISDEKEVNDMARTGYTPQMRIVDFGDVDAEFAVYSPYTEPSSTPIDTMKCVIFSESCDDTMKEVVVEQSVEIAENAEPTGELAKEVLLEKDATYLRVFRNFIKSSGDNDAFIQRQPRYDALQAQRICSHLRRDFPLIPSRNLQQHRATSRTSKIIKQREVGEDLCTSLWALLALRWLNFGHVLTSPAHDILVAASVRMLTKRLTIRGDQRTTEMLEGIKDEETDDSERRRVLDLGGQPIADWGWHCAYDYPKSKVYTVNTRLSKAENGNSVDGADDPNSQQEIPKYCGPKNHRHITVSQLWRLPFPDNHFDVVSVRTLYTLLKMNRHASRPNPISILEDKGKSPSQEISDEYDLCLQECFRVLKPGGYLEFFVLDADLINAGPEGQALSSDFTKQLAGLGYDANPCTRWISRLNKIGYGEIKRAWIFCPMAPPVQKPKVPSKGDDDNIRGHTRNRSTSSNINKDAFIDDAKEEVRRKLEAWEHLGGQRGTMANVASVSGLLGSWIWEKWMLKTNAEARNTSQWQLAIGRISEALEEARETGSGWRALLGWARKPFNTSWVRSGADKTRPNPSLG